MQTTRIMIVLLAAAGMATAGSLAYAQNSQPTVQAPVQQAVAPAAAAEAVPAAVAQPAPIGIEQAIAAAHARQHARVVVGGEIPCAALRNGVFNRCAAVWAATGIVRQRLTAGFTIHKHNSF